MVSICTELVFDLVLGLGVAKYLRQSSGPDWKVGQYSFRPGKLGKLTC